MFHTILLLKCASPLGPDLRFLFSAVPLVAFTVELRGGRLGKRNVRIVLSFFLLGRSRVIGPKVALYCLGDSIIVILYLILTDLQIRIIALYNYKNIFPNYDENGLDPYIISKNTLKLNTELNFKKLDFKIAFDTLERSGLIPVRCSINMELSLRRLSNRTSSEFFTVLGGCPF